MHVYGPVPNLAIVESRTGAVAWAMRQRSVSRPRSSNRTCGFPASGFPTGFTARHTAAAECGACCRSSGRWQTRPATPIGVRLRRGVKLLQKRPDTQGCSRLIANHRSSAPSKAHQKQGPFPPPALPGLNGRMALSDSRPTRRLCDVWGCQPQSRRVSPDDPHHPSNVPCPVPRRIETGACVDCFPAHTAFPVSQAGRHPHLHFRGLLRLHARYGPLDCSTAQGGLCHEAPAQSVARPSRSSATGAIDNSPGGTFLHW